jgi:hypothetical protein
MRDGRRKPFSIFSEIDEEITLSLIKGLWKNLAEENNVSSPFVVFVEALDDSESSRFSFF